MISDLKLLKIKSFIYFFKSFVTYDIIRVNEISKSPLKKFYEYEGGGI